MRYLLHESDNRLSPIEKEVEFIRSYVDLMKLRYPGGVRITLSIPDLIPDKSIPPLLFISLIENAFKHGISYLHESFIDIDLTFASDSLNLTIINSKFDRNESLSESGIGMLNTRKRLDLLFKERYALEVTDTGKLFVTSLTIPI